MTNVKLSVALTAFHVLVLLPLMATGATDDDSCDYVSYNGLAHSAVSILEPLKGKTYSCVDMKKQEFKYEVSICKTILPPPIETNSPEPKTEGTVTIKAGAIQIEMNDKNQIIHTHSLGDIKKADFIAGSNWVKLEYRDGDGYGSHCSSEGRRAVIMIICDEQETNGHLELIEENTNKTSECYYLFELSHAAVCVYTKSGQLGPGSIVAIVFFVVVGAYLLFGFVYQRFVVHAQGKEQIPHYPFWQDVGNLSADGCNYIFRSNKSGDSDRQYRGIGDDQLKPSCSDDPPSDVDEHLLPM